jgi:thioredoxin 1
MALNITNENYEALMADSKPLVIDFWAEWCGPCRMVAPIVEELAEEYADSVNIGKCDVDSCDDITALYRVRNIPTLVFIKGGEVVDKHVGAINKADLKAKIDALL